MFNCEARNEGGTMVCHRCGLQWDMDEEKPRCSSNQEVEKERRRRRSAYAHAKCKRILDDLED